MRKSLFRKLTALALSLLVGVSLSAQQKVTISGVVTDDQNEPMIAAGVVQKGTTNGTVTDVDGNFTLTVPAGSVIEFSSVGYVSQEYVAAKTETITIKMLTDTQMIEETVVVGYGVQRKSDVTGSISQVKTEDIQNRTITTPEQALQGKTAGVQLVNSSARPGANPEVRIRGVSSNGTGSSSNGPLYVVDGRISSSISGIDPNDIESMEVLKDGASAAIYGARAGNGVVLITTRKGAGEGKITYSFQLSSQSLAKIPHMMNSEQFMQYYIEAGKFDMETFYRNWDMTTNTDWIDYSYENSLMHRHNLTFAAGNDRGSLYISGTYLNNNGMFVGNNDVYSRLTFMVNGSWKFKPWLDIQTNNQVEYYEAQSVSEGSDYGSAVLAALTLDPLTPTVFNGTNVPDYVTAANTENLPYLTDENGNVYGISYFNQSENVNPRIMRDRAHTEYKGFNINGSTALNFRPWKELTITSRLGYRFSASDSYNYGHDYYVNGNASQNYISLSASNSNTIYYQWENFANWMHQFGKHNVSAMVGMSYSQNRSTSVSGSSSPGAGWTRVDDTGAVDRGVLQDNLLFYYLAYTTPNMTKMASGGQAAYSRTLSYFGRVGWSYLGRYNLQASLRADAADLSILPLNKRWGYFPAVSAGWTISDENFFSGIKNAVNYAKFRASWGQNGNTAGLGSYMYASTIGSTGYYPISSITPGQYITGYAPSYAGNDELKWETSEQLNFGLDLRFLNDRLTFTVDWFNKTTKDLIVSGITPSTVVGIAASPVNAGNVVNRGWEFEIRWRDQVGKDFTYGVSANLSTLHNEVTYIHESLSDGIDGATVRNYGTITRFEKGFPAWHFYGYKFAGIDSATGDALFYKLTQKNGVPTTETTNLPTDADKTDLGSGIPKVNAGLTLNMAWKGIDLTVFATGAFGSKIFNALNVVDYARNRLTYFTEDRWTPTHTNATMPAAGASNWTQFLTSDGVVFDGSYVKIKQIQLGYTFPQNLTRKIKIDNLRIYGSLDDYFTFTKYPGFDPEVTGSGNGLGVDKGSYPTSKKLVFGINITF
ncbi:MAG: TonB-dependent receptor [Bacteroidales bacterium]|nr:TonB-dependent receptor [Bacteroidales bacterium]MBQ9702842.1 TonB-dependent receptor [Bacteroidales bacterium]